MVMRWIASIVAAALFLVGAGLAMVSSDPHTIWIGDALCLAGCALGIPCLHAWIDP